MRMDCTCLFVNLLHRSSIINVDISAVVERGIYESTHVSPNVNNAISEKYSEIGTIVDVSEEYITTLIAVRRGRRMMFWERT